MAAAVRDRRVRVGLALMLDADFRAATLPLFADGVVDALEWSFDMRWRGLPPWAEALLDHYASEGVLLAHGVSFSPLSAEWTPRQQSWLERARTECARRRYVQVSEHCAFTAAGDFVDGPPLPVPDNDDALRIGRDRLARLADACERPVGLENNAFAFSRLDVDAHGDFLDAVLAPSGGFLVLDVHNLWCQARNFDLDAGELAASYPLHRVVELHVSGGSWQAVAPDQHPVRRDTHDQAVPAEVFDLLAELLPRCPAARWVILERLGGTLPDAAAHARLREDFHRLRTIAAGRGAARTAGPRAMPVPAAGEPLRCDELARWQAELLEALAAGEPPPTTAAMADYVAAMEPRMLATAGELVRRWGRRAAGASAGRA